MKAPVSTTKEYKVLALLHHLGKDYLAGTMVPLDPEIAKTLAGLGVIQLSDADAAAD